jgi:DNA-binding transcriptional MerR regulator
VSASKPNGSTENGVDRLWPMGAVTRRTGIGEHTLRAWERRFGFPQPERLPSGHRRYTHAQVQQLLLINAALAHGYRAGDVVPLPLDELEELLRQHESVDAPLAESSNDDWTTAVLDACRRFDRSALTSLLQRETVRLGVPRFVRERVAPTLYDIGEIWARGGLEIRHEHFFSEVLEDHLRVLRTPLEATAKGRPVLLATLPDEHHGLGLQIVALLISAAERSVRILGPHVPVDEIVEAAAAVDAAAVGLSISPFAVTDETVEVVGELRDALPASVSLWLGGAGADDLEGLPDGTLVVTEAEDLERELSRLGG